MIFILTKSLFPKGTTLLIMMLCCTSWFRLTDDYKSKKKIFWGGHKNLDHLPFLIWQKSYSSVSNYIWKMGRFFMVFFTDFTWICNTVHCMYILCRVHIFWEGHKILRNLHQFFDWQYIGQRIGDLAKFCGLLRIDEL